MNLFTTNKSKYDFKYLNKKFNVLQYSYNTYYCNTNVVKICILTLQNKIILSLTLSSNGCPDVTQSQLSTDHKTGVCTHFMQQSIRTRQIAQNELFQEIVAQEIVPLLQYLDVKIKITCNYRPRKSSKKYEISVL